ncbi:MAG: D-alanyl-D-alanine carboxypeptidase [Actinobacteria bacterium]|nr:D-alanyl-D-alanine carboxypeptidase [Actinomycetota bacterium]
MSGRRIGALLGILLALLFCASAEAAETQTEAPQVLARSWAVIDGRTGEVLTQHDGEKELPIASTTKLMTAYVAMKDLPLGKIVRARPYEAEPGETVLGLPPGTKVSVRDLIYAMILLSAGDAANTLAIDAAGSVPRFVAQMNRYAAALGLTNTHYANPIGLDQPGNYSSALDLVALARELEAIPAFAKIADSREVVLRSLRPRRRIHTINDLLEMASWATGVKTGHTLQAGYVLVGAGRKEGIQLISAAVGAPTDEARFTDNLELLEWGFRQYSHREVVRRGQALASPSIQYSGGNLPLRAARTLTVGLRVGQKATVEVDAPEQVTGPIRRGARLGTAVVTVDGLRAGSVPLLAGRAVPEASAFDRIRGFLGEHLVPLAITACAILIAAILLGRSIRRIRRGKRVSKK